MWKLLNVLRPRRARMESDLDRELRFHVDRRAADLMRGGMNEGDARRQADAELGGRAQVQEEVRDTWIWRWLADRGRDTRVAARGLVRRPAFTLTAILSIAIGIGASAAIFSLVDHVLLRQLPVREPDRLVVIDWRGSQLAPGWGGGPLVSYPLCRDLHEQKDFFDGVFCRHPTSVNLSTGGRSEPAGAEIVSGSYFSVLGVRPAIGRLLAESDDREPGAHPVVVLSHSYWRTRLDADRDIVGRTVFVNSFPMTVIGVAEAGFGGVDVGWMPAVWVPAMMKRQVTPDWDQLLNRRARWMHVFARIAPGLTVDEAIAGVQPWFRTMLQTDMTLESFPSASESQRSAFLESTLIATSAARGYSSLRIQLDDPLWVLMAGTLLLHLLASLNVASLFLARGTARVREIQTRMAIGASRGRIVGLLVADSLMVATLGAIAALVAAPLVSNSLVSFLPADTAVAALTRGVDLRVFGFACLAALATTLVCGLALVWQSARIPLVATLRERSGGSSGVRVRRALVVGQMAFTLILLVGAGLFVQTLARLQAKGPGFSTTNVVTFRVDPRRSGDSDDEAAHKMRAILARLDTMPIVDSAAIAGIHLLDGGSWSQRLTIDTGDRVATDRAVHINLVTANFFSTMGIDVVAGRDFDVRDQRPLEARGQARSVIINEGLARRYFGDVNPIGRRLGLGNAPDTATDLEIVGIVRDFAYRDLREQTEQMFLPLFETGGEAGTFYVRVRGSADTARASMRAAVADVDPALPLISLLSLDEEVEHSLTIERILATLSSGFGAVALLLSVVGLYGILSFVVANRRREIGIRLALGATRSSALWSVVRDALIMIAIGTAIALPCVWALGRLVEAQLYGVTALDTSTIATASALLALVALAGTMIPAWRAASVKPTEALRAE